MKLVDDWRDWRHWWSMRFILLTAFFGAFIASYQILPADWLPEIPAFVKRYLGLIIPFTAGAAALSRITRQKGFKRRYTDIHEDRRAPANPGKTPCSEPPKDSMP